MAQTTLTHTSRNQMRAQYKLDVVRFGKPQRVEQLDPGTMEVVGLRMVFNDVLYYAIDEDTVTRRWQNAMRTATLVAQK